MLYKIHWFLKIQEAFLPVNRTVKICQSNEPIINIHVVTTLLSRRWSSPFCTYVLRRRWQKNFSNWTGRASYLPAVRNHKVENALHNWTFSVQIALTNQSHCALSISFQSILVRGLVCPPITRERACTGNEIGALFAL